MGSQGLPRSSKGLPKGSQGLLGVGWGSQGLELCVYIMVILYVCVPFFCYCKLSFLKICVSSNNFLLCKGGFKSVNVCRYVCMYVCTYVGGMYISAKWSSAGLCNRLVLATLAASQPATQPASQRGPCNYLELSSAGVGLAPSDDVGSAHGDFFCPPAALGVSVTLPVPLALFADPPQHSRTCRGRMSCLH